MEKIKDAWARFTDTAAARKAIDAWTMLAGCVIAFFDSKVFLALSLLAGLYMTVQLIIIALTGSPVRW